MSCSGPSDVSGARCGALNLKGPVTMALAVFRQFDHTISLARDFARIGHLYGNATRFPAVRETVPPTDQSVGSSDPHLARSGQTCSRCMRTTSGRIVLGRDVQDCALVSIK